MRRPVRGVRLREDHRDPDRQRAGGRVLRGQPDGEGPCSRQGHRRPGGLGALVLDGQRFPEPRTQFFNLDTTGEIAFGMENLGVPREEMHRRVRGVVRELGVERLMGRGIFELSGARCNRWPSRAHGPASRASTSSTSHRAIWILPPWRSSPPSSRKPSRVGLP